MTLTDQVALQTLATIADPEIPVVNIVEMGMVRAVRIAGRSAEVDFAPTFSGCPALHTIQADIRRSLRALGVDAIRINVQLNPPWTSDAITPAAREKLRAYGLAPPPIGGNVMLLEAAVCPRCGSGDTRMRNAFGTTLCRMIFTCEACHETFEQFKPV